MKTFYTLVSLIALALSLVGFSMMIGGRGLMGLLVFIISIVLAFYGVVSVNKVKAKRKKKQEDETLLGKVKNAMTDCELAIKKAKSHYNRIFDWTKQAILEVFGQFIGKSKRDLVNGYEYIRSQYASQVEQRLVLECDKIVEGYRNQLRLQESKVRFYEKLHGEYRRTYHQLLQHEENEAKMQRLKSHKERLQQMDGDNHGYEKAHMDADSFNELKRDFEEKQEYYHQVDQLSVQYGTDDVSLDNALYFEQQINQLILDLDKK